MGGGAVRDNAAADTEPIRDEERFDEEAVAAYLHAHLPEIVADRDIAFDQFPGGAANLTYRAVAGDAELVLRRAPLGPVAVGGHDMAREFKVLSRLWVEYPLAPRALHFCEDDSVMGKPFQVIERRRGPVIRSNWPPGWGREDPVRRRTLAQNLVDGLARLHRVDPVRVGLEDLGRPSGFVSRQVAGWRKRWEAARTRPLDDMEAVATELAARVPEPQTATILHNDYKLDNVMVDDGGELVAVFDWDMATLGDPLVDIGTLLAYWPDPDNATFPVFGAAAPALSPYLTRAQALSRYAALTGFDTATIAYYEGLALYRIAVILEQILARYQAGQTSDERFASFEVVVPLLATAARRTLEEA